MLRFSGEKLIHHFLLHVLPKGLMRIRHCGFLANRCRRAKLAGIRQAIGRAQTQERLTEPDTGLDRPYRGPHCRRGRRCG